MKSNRKRFQRLLECELLPFKFMKISGHPESPLKHLSLVENVQLSKEEEVVILTKIMQHCEDNGIAIVVSKKVAQDITFDKKSIRKF